MSIGRRIYTQIERPDKNLIERLAKYSTADLSDAMNMAGTMDPGIRPAFTPVPRVVGPAVTISVPTGAQIVRKMGFAQTQPGDVIVISGMGARHYAMLGSNIGLGLRHRGVAGLVIDGAFRDLSDFRQMGMPIFARGVCTLPGPKEGPGEVNVPVSCGSVVVNPGDIIVADEDGVVAIPPAAAEEIIIRVEQLIAGFAAIQDQLRRGAVTNIDNIKKELNASGFTFVDSPYQRR